MKTLKKVIKRKDRQRRIRSKIFGSCKCPRLAIFSSLTCTLAQLIDDEKGITLVSAVSSGKKVEDALKIGQEIAQKAKEKKISQCVFDRGGYVFHGRVKAVATGAREGGLKF